MKRIVPMNCSQDEFVKFAIDNKIFTRESYEAALIDNAEYQFKGRPLRANFPWGFDEDYVVIYLTLDLKTPDFISKIIHRSRTAILSRLVYLLGTSDWIKIITLSSDIKMRLIQYFYICWLENKPYAGRINVLETVELVHFLEECGFNANNSY